MQSIQLTDEHKSKLLEMCEALFPEQSPFHLGLPGEIRKGWGYSRNFLFGKVFSEDGIIIHWFEFCMTHLMYKLSYEFSKISNIKGRSIHIELWELNKGDYFKKHPIDYLYEEFKKL